MSFRKSLSSQIIQFLSDILSPIDSVLIWKYNDSDKILDTILDRICTYIKCSWVC